MQGLGKLLDQSAMLIAGIVQHYRDRFSYMSGRYFSQQLTDRLRRDVAVIGHPDQSMTHGVKRPKHIVSLASRSTAYKQPRRAPQPAQKTAQHKVNGIHKIHSPLARLGFLQARLKLPLLKNPPVGRYARPHFSGAEEAPPRSYASATPTVRVKNGEPEWGYAESP